jgi:succinoglycan biosynthesis transport protein ExoP
MSQQPEPTTDLGRASLRDYISILQVRKWSIVLVTLMVVGVALLFSSRQTPMYRSETRFLVKPVSISGDEGDTRSGLNMETERQLLASTGVARIVSNNLDLDRAPNALLGNLAVEVITGTEILLISYQASDPRRARDMTNEFSRAYALFRRQQVLEDLRATSNDVRDEIADLRTEQAEVEQSLGTEPVNSPERGELEGDIAGFEAQIAALEQDLQDLVNPVDLQVGEVIQPAQIPSEPVSPDHIRTGALSLVAGLLLGAGVAFVRERLDDRLRGRADLEEHLGAPVLAVIPRVASWRKSSATPLVTIEEPRSAASEAYRTLRTSLLFAANQRGAKTILVVSPHAGEGKTATSANLAIVLAHARKRVILLSADLRKPRIHRFFNVSNQAGLTGVLTGQARPWEAILNGGSEYLKIVPSGPIPGNPAELLASDAMGRLIAQFREVSDFVIIDSAPILVVADALTLAPFVDAALFVADAETTTRAAAFHARTQLEQVSAPVIGGVLNNFDPTKARTSPYYYSYYYMYKYEEAPRGRRLRRRQIGRDEGPYPVGVATPGTGFEPAQGDRVRAADTDVEAEDQEVATAEIEGLWAPPPPPPPAPEARTEPDGRAGWRLRRRR